MNSPRCRQVCAHSWADYAWTRLRAAFSLLLFRMDSNSSLVLRAICIWVPAYLSSASFLHKLIPSHISSFHLVIGPSVGELICLFIHSLTYSFNKLHALPSHCPLDGMFTLPMCNDCAPHPAASFFPSSSSGSSVFSRSFYLPILQCSFPWPSHSQYFLSTSAE